MDVVVLRWPGQEDERARLASVGMPRLLLDDVLRRGSAWVPLPAVEARMARALVAGFGHVVRRADLSGAAWPDGDAGRNALDVHGLRLRRRMGPLGLGIRTVRSRGYVLEASAVAPAGRSGRVDS